MDQLLIGYTLAGRTALVAGGNEAALRKARLVLKTPARLHVVTPDPCRGLEALASEDRLTIERRRFRERDLEGSAVVFAATGDANEDRRISELARALNIPVNVPDRPDISSFTVPALIDRDPIVVGVTTGGTAPVLGRRIRAQIENLLPSDIGRLARFAAGFRQSVKSLWTDGSARRRFWEDFFSGPIADEVLSGDLAAATRRTISRLNRASEDPEGIVHIVGAGPGDPDLLTVKAMRLIQEADVIVHDRLVAPEILDRARRDAERVYAGKRRADHGMGQDGINALMADRARRGRKVVRLKGGDPFIFGRGGEEQDYLRRHGIRVEIVPGITAASGCAAAAGIPLTHRDHASAVTFVTGHGVDGIPEVDWRTLAAERQTLAVYMGLTLAGTLSTRLIEAGLPASTPVAVIENGTRPNQRVLASTIDRLETLVTAERVDGPAIVLIGEVAAKAIENEETVPAALAAAL